MLTFNDIMVGVFISNCCQSIEMQLTFACRLYPIILLNSIIKSSFLEIPQDPLCRLSCCLWIVILLSCHCFVVFFHYCTSQNLESNIGQEFNFILNERLFLILGKHSIVTINMLCPLSKLSFLLRPLRVFFLNEWMMNLVKCIFLYSIY